MGRNYLVGDAANAILAAVGYNFRLLVVWLAMLLYACLTSLAPHLAKHLIGFKAA